MATRDFVIPFNLEEGKVYIDRARAVWALDEATRHADHSDVSLIAHAVGKLSGSLDENRRYLRTASNVSAHHREYHVVDGWFVPIAPRTKTSTSATLCRKVGPRKPQEHIYGDGVVRLLTDLAAERHPDDPEKRSGWFGLMLYRLQDAVFWINLLANTEKMRDYAGMMRTGRF